MTVRTLAEAAADVLNATRKSAPSEPMHKMSAEVEDLGGATWENPEGSHVGEVAAKNRSQATPPGVAPSSETSEKMKKLPPQVQDTAVKYIKSAEDLNDHPDTAGHGYAHPTKSEEVELEASETEEMISEEDFEDVELTEEEILEAKKAKHHWMKEKMKHMAGMKEDMDALFNGEDLSEEYKEKVTTIFESAVIARAVQVVEEMEEEILNAAQESLEEIKAELEEQVDAYLSYMAEEWVKENEVAIESGLKTEIAEEFISSLKNVFEQHYIDIPEEKVDVLSAMAEENEVLKNELNEALNKNIELAHAIVEARKLEIATSVCEGLTATQAEKVKTLAEGVEFTTEGDYSKKLGIIRENYFTSGSKVQQAKSNPIALTESEQPVETSEVSPVMERYVNALSRTSPR
jgi:hypothetical protein